MGSYVIFWGKEDYYKKSMSELLQDERVEYIEEILHGKTKVLRFLHKVHNSSAINKIIPIPFKRIWFSSYMGGRGANDEPNYFIFHGSYYWLRVNGYFDYLKNKYPKAKLVYVLMDTVDSYKNYFSDRFRNGFDLKYLEDRFDLILTYNKNDADQYQLTYYPSIYTMTKSEKKLICKNDVFFIGRAKDRLEEIQQAFKILRQNGFSCEFYITGVEIEKQKYKEEIHYNEFLSYSDVLEHVKESKAILEIIQKGTNAFTFRINEALLYDKVLITNNPIILDLPIKWREKIFEYQEIGNITKERLEEALNKSFEYDNRYSPKAFLKYIEEFFK